MSEQHDLTKAQSYSALNIEERDGLAAMRGTPTLFLSDLEHGGITHSALEVITNSNDELMAYPHADAKLIVVLCKDPARNSFQWVIQDTGRGMPYEIGSTGKSVFVQCLTKPHTSGKFNQDSYTISGGQFGVGLKATTAMSLVLRCITHRQSGTASLTVRQGVFNPTDMIVDETYRSVSTGTTTVYEPDATIFAGVESYAEVGYAQVVSLLRQMVFFRFKNIEFRISDRPVDPGFWDDRDLRTADAYINKLIADAPVIWDAKTNDPDGWIRSYWNLNRHFSWHAEIGMTPEEKRQYETGTPAEQRLRDVIIKLYLVKGDRSGGVFALVNSVPIPNRGSDHVAVIPAMLKESLADRISDAGEKKFFLESYVLPLFYAINVDYKGAKFSNAAKTDFKEGDFRRIYGELLSHWFKETPHGEDIVNKLYDQLKEDIAQRYADSLGKKTQSSDTSRLWTRLHKYKNFIDASPPDGDRSSCEIILLEGKSTGGGEGGEDADRKGIYYMQGKPCNALKGTHGNRNEVIANMLKHEILSDIFTIINYDPRKPDLDKLYFGSGVIATDAD